MNDINHLFEQNKQWAEKITNEQPEFFDQLSQQQTPEYLWIGCSDSRVPANQLLGLLPGEIFVHRNIANVVVHTDLNCLSVIQYAVEVLKVKHIFVCGHYGCGGVAASMTDAQHGLIDNWLRHIKDVQRFNQEELESLSEQERFNRLCELNVIEQVKNVANTTMVQNAWNDGQPVTVHGFIYDIHNGILKNLEVSVSGS
ncbi:carbonate dehydratase [Thalassotalea litorea]|uniref:carbonate dehydratase n=1 Tax=Thalassotalea litorea TaxID=2020715 RepID=UPI0037368442